MPKYHKIRWRNKDQRDLARVVKNFNAKIDYQIKRNPYISDLLPEKVRMRDIKKNILTRKDLEFELSRLRAFSKRNALDIVDVKGGARITKWEYQQAKRMLRRINNRKEKARKEANVSTEKGTMGSIAKNNLNDKQFLGNKGQKSWNKFYESLVKQYPDSYWFASDEAYKENYIKALKEILGAGNSEYYDKIKQIVSKLPASELVQAQYDIPLLTINFMYPDSDEIDLDEEIAEPMYNAWVNWLSQ